MAQQWIEDEGLRVTALFSSNAGNTERNYWVHISGLQDVGDTGKWRRFDSELDDVDRGELVTLLATAMAGNRPVWILQETHLGRPTTYIKGAYVF